MSVSDFLPDCLFDDVRTNYGNTLTDDMIIQSVQQASDFFNIENPMAIGEEALTGVYPNSPLSPMDDVLVFSREQLIGLGITGQDGLDLVMTHEGAHRALQGMNTGFNSHQEELCCDFMAGVCAELNGIDMSQMKNSLADATADETHPDGHYRVDAVERGAEFAADYYNTHHVAPTFSDCLSYFTGNADIADLGKDAHINLRKESSNAMVFTDSSNGEIKAYSMANTANDEIVAIPSYEELKDMGFTDHLATQISDGGSSYSYEELMAVLNSDNPIEAYNEMMEQKVNAALETADIRIAEAEGILYDSDNNVSFKGYTQSEINSKMNEARHEMDYQESNMRHRKSMMESKARMGESFSYEESQYKIAQAEFNRAQAEYNKWRNTKPTT